jgi:hypothetical protein
MNGDAELKENDLVRLIGNLGRRGSSKVISSPRNLWCKLKAENVICLELSRNVQVELRRQMWKTYTNLGDWYDQLESFCIEYVFGENDGDGKVVVTEDQERRISNMDETKKLSMDESDEEIGGRPSNSITIAGTTISGTITHKASLSSTIMCGSTAAGEPLPVHVIFSSDAQKENMVVDYRWIADFPRVQGWYGHEVVRAYCIQLTVNEKGESVCCTSHQCLMEYQQRMWPDAADIPDNQALYNIDGGPGRVDEGALAESRTPGVYLFNKSRRKWASTMVSSSPMCELTSQHSPWISRGNTLGSRRIAKLTQSTILLPPRYPNREENTMVSSYLEERPIKQTACLHSARYFIMPFSDQQP